MAFDLDGVVIPSDPSFDYFESRYGITRADWQSFFVGSYQAAMLGRVDVLDVLRPMLQRWKWNGTAEEFADEWMKSCRDADPNIIEILSRLKNRGVSCCVASNQDSRRAGFLDSLEWINNAFFKRYYSCRLGVMKPAGSYFRSIQQDSGFAPEHILFVDDRIENVEGARACGWSAEVCRGAADIELVIERYFE